MNKVFISYAHANAEFAVRLERDLRAAGLDVWMDRAGLESGIAPGSGWADSIEQALKDCGAAVGIYSPESMQSNARAEWDRLLALGKPFFPVRLRHCEIPWKLAPIQYIDFVDRAYEEPLSDLLEALRHALRPPHVFLNIAEDDRRWLDKFKSDLSALVSYQLDRTLRFGASPSPSPEDAPLFIAVASRAWLASETAQLEVAKFLMRADPATSRLRQLKLLREPLSAEAASGEGAPVADPLADLEPIQFFFNLDDPKTKSELLPIAREVSHRLQTLLAEHDSADAVPEAPPAQAGIAETREATPPSPHTAPASAENGAPASAENGAPASAENGAPASGENGASRAVTGTVFLGQLDRQIRDIAADVNSLRRELERRGYRIVPSGEPPSDPAQIEAEAGAALEEADLAIHFLGAEYGAAVEGDWRSVQQLQLEASAGRAAGTDESAEPGRLKRLIWISAEVGEPSDPRQRELHAAVQQAGAETEWFKDQPLEAFKSVVLERLEALEKEKQKAKAAAGSPLVPGSSIYLIYDPADQEIAIELYKDLQSRQLRVWTPLFEGTPQEIDEVHEEYLQTCDAGLVVYGRAPARWWKLLLPRVSAWGRDKPLGHYFAEPRTPEKEVFDDPDAIEMKAWEESDLTPFLDALRVPGET